MECNRCGNHHKEECCPESRKAEALEDILQELRAIKEEVREE